VAAVSVGADGAGFCCGVRGRGLQGDRLASVPTAASGVEEEVEERGGSGHEMWWKLDELTVKLDQICLLRIC
jgi:hypothetical protein